MSERANSRRSGWFLGLLIVLPGVGLPVAAEAADRGARGLNHRQLSQVGGRVAWGVPLSMKFTTTVRSAHLVNEHLCVIGSDGRAWAIRADTGERAWSRLLAKPGQTLWPPTAIASPDAEAIVFARMDDVIFLEPATGLGLEVKEQDENGETQTRDVGPVRLRSVSLASAAASLDHVFVIAPGHRVRRYDVADNYEHWQADMPALLRVAPVYLPDRDLLLVVDTSGMFAGIDGQDRHKKFARQLKGEAVGWLAADQTVAYVATSKSELVALSLETGEPVLEESLPGRPVGGPVVTETGVYQATTSGVLRIAKNAEGKNWHVPATKQFLAEWPRHSVLLGDDDTLAFVAPGTGRLLATVDLGGKFTGVSNAHTDAVILVSPRGQVCCIRPIGAKPLVPADFRPPSVPAAEAGGELAEGEAGTEAEKAAEEEPADGEEESAEATGPRMTREERILADPLRERR